MPAVEVNLFAKHYPNVRLELEQLQDALNANTYVLRAKVGRESPVLTIFLSEDQVTELATMALSALTGGSLPDMESTVAAAVDVWRKMLTEPAPTFDVIQGNPESR